MSAILAVIRRELTLARRIGAGAGLGLLFFLIFVAIVPFAIGPDQKRLASLAPAILWLAALLASLLGLDRLLQGDEDDGVIDQFLLAPLPLPLILLAKTTAHWLVTGLPLALAAPMLGLMLAIEPNAMLPLALSLLIGTPALTCLGLIGASLTVSLRRGGLLLSILVLPSAIPVLIFGVSAATRSPDEGATSAFLLLAGTSLFFLALAPLAAALALGHARE